jgi:SOS-response transcriptional repressor LexA
MSSDGSRPSGLTVMEQNVLEMIVIGRRLAREGKGVSPSYREIMEWMGWKHHNSLSKVLRSLESKGYVRRQGKGSCRVIEVLR